MGACALHASQAFIADALKNISSSFAALDQYSAPVRRKLQRLRLYGGDPIDSAQRQELSRVILAMTNLYSTGNVTSAAGCVLVCCICS